MSTQLTPRHPQNAGRGGYAKASIAHPTKTGDTNRAGDDTGTRLTYRIEARAQLQLGRSRTYAP
jgi:hypothetical protein